MDTIVTLLNKLTVLASSLEALYLKLSLCSNNHPLHVKMCSQDPRVYHYFAMSNLFTGPRALSTHMWIDRGPWNRNSCTMFSQNLLVSRRLHFLMASGTLGQIGWGRSMKGLGDWKWFLKHRIQRDQSIYMYIYLFIHFLFIYLSIYLYLFIYIGIRYMRMSVHVYMHLRILSLLR